MNALLILPGYFSWHYTIAFKDIFQVWSTLLWFTYRTFSITQLLKTLFSPWHRITEKGPNTFDLEAWAGAIVVNIMSRIIGAAVRLSIILSGILVLLCVIVGGILYTVFWICAPLLIAGGFITGFIYLF